MSTVLTFKDLYNLPTTFIPGDGAIDELSKSLRWSVAEFEDNGRWTFEPLTDSTYMPPEAWHRKDLIDGTGIDVEWVVAHEIEYKPVTMPEVHISKEDEEMMKKVLLVALGVVAVAALLPFVIAGLALMAFACSSGDPQLLCKVTTKDGKTSWKSCYRWYSEH